jgi:hypothetical protein
MEHGSFALYTLWLGMISCHARDATSSAMVPRRHARYAFTRADEGCDLHAKNHPFLVLFFLVLWAMMGAVLVLLGRRSKTHVYGLAAGCYA